MLCAVKAKALACQIDAMGIVDEAVENGVGVSRINANDGLGLYLPNG
jgi:hypothetical protein